MKKAMPFVISNALTLLVILTFGLTGGCTTTEQFVKADDPHGNARLYRRKCSRCHGLYSPRSLSDTEWIEIFPEMADEAHLSPAHTERLLAWLTNNN